MAAKALPPNPGKLKLVYFPIKARGEAIRMALVMRPDLDWDDVHVPGSKWRPLKEAGKAAERVGAKLDQMPVLFTAHGSLTQSHAIERYVGRLTGLYPEDIWEAAKCDEVVDMAEDLNKRISMCLHKVPEFKAHSRSALATEYGPFWLGKMEKMLSSSPGPFFLGETLTMADLVVSTRVEYLHLGILDDVPATIVDAFPALVAHYTKVFAVPEIAAFRAKNVHAVPLADAQL